DSANQARAALGEDGKARIEIVDSRLASIALGLLVLSAAQRAGDARSHIQLAESVRAEAPLTNGYFVVDTLEYLRKGGRIGKAQAFLGSVLSVKPILTLHDGEAHPLERPRSRERAFKRLVELTKETAPLRQLAVIHSTEPDRAEALRESLSDLLPAEEILVARFGPTLGTYLGPQALGVAFTRAGPSVTA
ncbi:MAG: DegV family protein, partial [Chloroflexi bacterium]|nr:DegV family protein [Chloroflexota bacterium]